MAPQQLAIMNGVAPEAVAESVQQRYRDMYDIAMKTVKMKVCLVGPELAEAMLEKNSHNRPLSNKYAEEYKRAITDGEWRINGQGVIRSTEGAVLDGQHRLHGIILSGIPIPLLIIDGVEEETFKTIDQGKKRDFSGYLSMDGKLNANGLASAVRFVRVLSGESECNKHTIASLYETLAMYPGLEDSVSHIVKHRKKRIVFVGPHSALYHMTTLKHPGEVTSLFWEQFLTRTAHEKKSPVWRLIDTLTDTVNNKARIIPPRGVLAFTIKAFNATLQGKPLGLLKYGGSEKLPQII